MTEERKLPMCVIPSCMKQPDGAKAVETVRGHADLCGTHYDAWLGSPERRRVVHLSDSRFGAGFDDFVRRVGAEMKVEVEKRAVLKRLP